MLLNSDEMILDNCNHYLSCDQMPSEAEVMRMMDEHQDVIREIEQINPAFVGIALMKIGS